VLTPDEVDAPSVRRAVETVLTPDSPQRIAALHMASEIAAMPDARAAAETIEELVHDRSQ
jgi:hypothetical protein